MDGKVQVRTLWSDAQLSLVSVCYFTAGASGEYSGLLPEGEANLSLGRLEEEVPEELAAVKLPNPAHSGCRFRCSHSRQVARDLAKNLTLLSLSITSQG